MITERDLQEAIAECQGVRNPNASTCIKLASYYTIMDHLNPEPTYSYAPAENVVRLDSGSEFAELANGMDQHRLLSIIDELMETLSVLNPRLYQAVLRKMSE